MWQCYVLQQLRCGDDVSQSYQRDEMSLLWTKAHKPKFCPKCQSENLNERGVGVEQIEEETQKYSKKPM